MKQATGRPLNRSSKRREAISRVSFSSAVSCAAPLFGGELLGDAILAREDSRGDGEAGADLVPVQGLAQEVVHPRVEGGQPGGAVLAAAAQEEVDVRLGRGAELAAELDPVHPGQHPVRDHDPIGPLGVEGERLFGGESKIGLESQISEGPAGDSGGDGIVLHQKGAHGRQGNVHGSRAKRLILFIGARSVALDP